jgi:hypothetical protein
VDSGCLDRFFGMAIASLVAITAVVVAVFA